MTGSIKGNLPNKKIKLNPKGKNPGDVFAENNLWEINTQSFKGAHFATYPERLCELPIKSSCPQNGIVLDPFCGSGTTCLVAKRLNRNYIGVDLNPEYCAMAEERIKNEFN
ncbi:site-specific DNA-methyltransferase [Candidatus Poribacteria bacterium]|nr:site-specific DNA-methyltransferase [Candidatus Poribacteria bacterium]